jgi:hypothetical protein
MPHAVQQLGISATQFYGISSTTDGSEQDSHILPEGLVRGVDERIHRAVENFMVLDSQDSFGSLSSEPSRGGGLESRRSAEPEVQVECSQMPASDREEPVSNSASYTECRAL